MPVPTLYPLRRLDWGPWALISNHPDPDLAGTGAAKTYPSYHAAPNVDHSNSEVWGGC